MTDPETNVTRLRRSPAARVALTASRIEKAAPRARRYTIADATAPGLILQIEPSGAKAFYWRGSVGQGRAGRTQVMARIGDTASVGLHEARATALGYAATARAGEDPRQERGALLADALDRYEASLARRRYVKRADVMSALRRNLKPHLRRSLADLDRAAVAKAIGALEAEGKEGAAAYLRKCASAFLAWAEGEGLIERNPLLGWRRPKATREERLRAGDRWTPVGEEALRATWAAFDASLDPRFTVFLRLLLCTGLRRQELAGARWADVDLDVGVLRLDAARTKMGVARDVPLGPMSLQLLRDLPRLDDHRGLIFPGRAVGKQMSGWSQRLAPIRAAAGGEPVSPHGLRRAYRSGLSELGVSFDIAEMMIGHQRKGLAAVYDHSTLDAQRRKAQELWEAHLAAFVG